MNQKNNNLSLILEEVFNKHKHTQGGKTASYIPELAKVNPELFGIAIVTMAGDVISIGDADVPFAIESISKPFIYALALEDNGEDPVNHQVGLNATGLEFNSIVAIKERPQRLQNPLVNAGAIQVTSFIKGQNSNEKWERALHFIQRLSDGKPYLGEAVYYSESATNQHNQMIATLLDSYGMVRGDVMEALDRYTKACSIMATAKQLGLMGSVLANGGLHPITQERLINKRYVRGILAGMLTNGLYEHSGDWLWSVGIPAKSGVSGAILAVIPNEMAMVVYSPPIDDAGNSVKGQQVIEDLSERLGLHLLELRQAI